MLSSVVRQMDTALVSRVSSVLCPNASCQAGCYHTAQVAILRKNWLLLSVQTPYSFHSVPSALGLPSMSTFFP